MNTLLSKRVALRLTIGSVVALISVVMGNFVILLTVYGCAGQSFDDLASTSGCSESRLGLYAVIVKVCTGIGVAAFLALLVGIAGLISNRKRNS